MKKIIFYLLIFCSSLFAVQEYEVFIREYQNSDGTIARDETKYITKWNPETKEFYITGKEPRTIKIGGYGIGSYDPSEDADKW